MIVMVQVADLSQVMSSYEVVTLSTFKSFWCQVKSWTQTQVTARSIPHGQCWIENLSYLLSLQYKENKGKFAASYGRLKAKSFSASGGLCSPDPLTRGSAPGPRWGLRPQTPVIGSRSRARHKRSLFDPHFSLPSAAPGLYLLPFLRYSEMLVDNRQF